MQRSCRLKQELAAARKHSSTSSKAPSSDIVRSSTACWAAITESAYRKYMRECDVLVQFCMAHLIRDVKFLLTLPGREVQAYGQRLRDALRDLFGVIHRREKMTAAGSLKKALAAAREQVITAATARVPEAKHARNLAKRFREHGEAYFRFITTPGIESDEQSGGAGDSLCRD